MPLSPRALGLTLAAWLAASLGAGCEAEPVEPPLEAPDAAPPVGCGALQVAYARELARVSRYCTDETDCLVVGGAGRCGCVPSIGPCRGEAVSGAAFTASLASEYGRQFVRACSDPLLCDSNLTCGCDCAPSRATCINNRCQIVPGDPCP